MIDRLRALARRWWPVIRLRWLFFGTLLLVAALPGFAALGLRVYENALVRRTEAELTAQAAAIGATAALLWPGVDSAVPIADPTSPVSTAGNRSASYIETPSEIDLRTSPVLAARPPARVVDAAADPRAVQVAARMAPVVAEIKETTLASILLLDRRGVLLNGAEKGRSLAFLPEITHALEGSHITVLRRNDSYGHFSPVDMISRATATRLHHARPVRVSGRVVGVVLVSRSPAALFRGMWEDAGKILAGTLAILLALAGLSFVLARAIVRPIEKLSEAARTLAGGQPVSPVRPTLEITEIRDLYDDFAIMARSIARRSRYLRDFAAALSHEFKTPLAGLRGGIELLQDHGPSMSEAERERFLANMQGDADRLARLVSRLMELAQADMRADAVAKPSLIEPILQRLRDGLAGPDFDIEIQVPVNLPPLAIEAAELETIVTTLAENARQAGACRLRIHVQADPEGCMIVLADDGPGIPLADRARVFDPFFTSKRASGGTGLGLPIALALLHNRGGTMELADDGPGAQFVVRLPFA